MRSRTSESSGRSLASTSGIALPFVGPKAMYFVSSACGFGWSAQLMNFIAFWALGAPVGTTHPS